MSTYIWGELTHLLSGMNHQVNKVHLTSIWLEGISYEYWRAVSSDWHRLIFFVLCNTCSSSPIRKEVPFESRDNTIIYFKTQDRVNFQTGIMSQCSRQRRVRFPGIVDTTPVNHFDHKCFARTCLKWVWHVLRQTLNKQSGVTTQIHVTTGSSYLLIPCNETCGHLHCHVGHSSRE